MIINQMFLSNEVMQKIFVELTKTEKDEPVIHLINDEITRKNCIKILIKEGFTVLEVGNKIEIFIK